MRRPVALALAVAAALLLGAGAAQAAAPTLGPVSATDIQGVSALLKGTVDPGGQATTYAFEYVDQAGFEASAFAAAATTPAAPAGSGGEAHPARAAVTGLRPDTTYHYRLTAHNSAGDPLGTPATFTTTHGFGFLPGEEGFAVSAMADGGAAATLAGSHPYKLDFEVGLNLGGDAIALRFPDRQLRGDAALARRAGCDGRTARVAYSARQSLFPRAIHTHLCSPRFIQTFA